MRQDHQHPVHSQEGESGCEGQTGQYRDRRGANLVFRLPPPVACTVKGMKTRFHLYTVPGQSYYNASRKLVLQGVDGVVFVADSQVTRLDENVESYLNLWDN